MPALDDVFSFRVGDTSRIYHKFEPELPVGNLQGFHASDSFLIDSFLINFEAHDNYNSLSYEYLDADSLTLEFAVTDTIFRGTQYFFLMPFQYNDKIFFSFNWKCKAYLHYAEHLGLVYYSPAPPDLYLAFRIKKENLFRYGWLKIYNNMGRFISAYGIEN